jgi:hypothetical protein
MNVFSLVRKKKQKEFVTIVSGLPRSGTSMMMNILEAGGLPPVTDEIRTADDDNPKGYYEFERVKKLPEGDNGWLNEARGKSVKVISALLEHLPKEYDYKVIFMYRDMAEILASQKQMLIRRNKPTDTIADEVIASQYKKHLAKIETWLAEQPNISVHPCHYNQLLKDPQVHIREIARYLRVPLDVSRMEEAVDLKLYRQRKSS